MRDLQGAPGTPLAAASIPHAQPASETPTLETHALETHALETQEAPQAPARRRRGIILGCVAAFVLAADAVTKALVVAHLREDQPVHLIGNVLMLWLTRNPGAAFSVGTGQTVVFTLIACAVIVVIVRTARRLYSLGWAIALGLLLGGAAGNLTDRIFRAPGVFRGDVVDWIAVTRYYPIFNLADSAIVCGGILMVLLALLGYHLDGTRAVHASEDDPTARRTSTDHTSTDHTSADHTSADHTSAGHTSAGGGFNQPPRPANGRDTDERRDPGLDSGR